MVRMALLPLEYLAETVGADPLVTESLQALRMFAEASHYSSAVEGCGACCGGERRAAAQAQARPGWGARGGWRIRWVIR